VSAELRIIIDVLDILPRLSWPSDSNSMPYSFAVLKYPVKTEVIFSKEYIGFINIPNGKAANALSI